jgi:AcrR family transcriptional regulator
MVTRAKRDAERTKRRILRAAVAEFAAKGLAGARVDAIARRARSNKRMIYQYFGNKEGLYVEVLETTYARFRGREKTLGLDDVGPVEAMRRLATFNLDYCHRHPEFISLLNNENLHRARHLKRAKTVPPLHASLAETIAKILARGERAGVFRKRVDPVGFYIALASLGYFYHSNRHTLSVIFRADIGHGESWRSYRREAVEMVLRYLHPAH